MIHTRATSARHRIALEIVVRSSTLLAGTAAVAVICASGAAHAARVGVFIGGAVPGYYVPGYYVPAQPYYYVPAPPPPPQYIQRGPDGQPEPAPGPYDPPYPPPGTSGQNAPDSYAAPSAQGTAPQQQQQPQQPANDSATRATPGSDDDSEPPLYSQGSGSEPVTPREGGDTWFFCDATKTYYPYVKDCTSGWRRVPAQPTQSPSQPQ
jgi:hypothetical protein